MLSGRIAGTYRPPVPHGRTEHPRLRHRQAVGHQKGFAQRTWGKRGVDQVHRPRLIDQHPNRQFGGHRLKKDSGDFGMGDIDVKKYRRGDVSVPRVVGRRIERRIRKPPDQKGRPRHDGRDEGFPVTWRGRRVRFHRVSGGGTGRRRWPRTPVGRAARDRRRRWFSRRLRRRRLHRRPADRLVAGLSQRLAPSQQSPGALTTPSRRCPWPPRARL